MAFKQVTPIDMTGNEIQNVRSQNVAGAPSGPQPGQFWYDTSIGAFMYRAASTNIDLRDRASHTGSQLAATISDFDTQVRASRLNQMAPPDAEVSFGGQKITSLANGVAATDAATVGQLANLINGTDWKQSVRAATTGNLAALSGLQTVDGITLVANDRVLVKNQTAAETNGIYIVGTGAWTRAADADAGTLSASAAVFVEEGTTQADTQWRLATDNVITVGTTPLAWSQIGSSTGYTNGAGLALAGNVFSVDTAVVVRKFAQDVAAGATSVAINHGLGTLDVTVGVFEVATGDEVGCDKRRTSTNSVTLGFAVAPTAGQYRAVIHA